MKKDNIATLVIIVILLVVFIPLTTIGTIKRLSETRDDNPKHELYYKGYLWFYNDNELLGKYECKTSVCNLAKTIIDDDEYHIKYDKGNLDNIGIINNKFVFVLDGDEINLIDIKSNLVLQKYNGIKNYNTLLDNNIYLLKNKNDKWGIVSISEGIVAYLPFEYDYIGLIYKTSEDKIDVNKLLVKKDNKWMVIDNTGKSLTNGYDYPIIDYNDNYIFFQNNDNIIASDKNNNRLLSDISIKDFSILEDYILLFTDKEVYLYNELEESPLKTYDNIKSDDKVSMEISGNRLYIRVNNSTFDTLEIR